MSPAELEEENKHRRVDEASDLARDSQTHISVIEATQLCSHVQDSPVSSKNNLASTCRNLGLSASPDHVSNVIRISQLENQLSEKDEDISNLRKVNIETVAELEKQLAKKDEAFLEAVNKFNSNYEKIALRVTKLEEQMVKKDEDISKLRKTNIGLQNQINVVKSDTMAIETPAPSEIEFIRDVQRELPSISDGLAELENKIEGLKKEIEELNTGVTRVAVNGGEGESENLNLGEINNEIRLFREQAKKESRRVHLQGEQRDQYSRRETIRLTGVPYKRGEDTTRLMVRIAESLGVYITASDISVSHRSGRRLDNAPRPILVRFVRREVKALILDNKKWASRIKVDDDGNPVRIFLDENLTSMRARVCKKLREDRTPHYTKDGKLFVTTEEGETKVYDAPADWENLDWPDNVKIELGIYPRD